jgi:hypothetical protein
MIKCARNRGGLSSLDAPLQKRRSRHCDLSYIDQTFTSIPSDDAQRLIVVAVNPGFTVPMLRSGP